MVDCKGMANGASEKTSLQPSGGVLFPYTGTRAEHSQAWQGFYRGGLPCVEKCPGFRPPERRATVAFTHGSREEQGLSSRGGRGLPFLPVLEGQAGQQSAAVKNQRTSLGYRCQW